MNHCINDIAVLGARPLFFLDYIGAEKLEPRVFTQILRGFTQACRAGGCALVGGETAQMPGMYRAANTISPAASSAWSIARKMIDGRRIKPGDVVLGLPSNGLHTNGYSLARKIFFEQMRLKPDARLPGLPKSLGEELLRTHGIISRCWRRCRNGKLKGLAHITGGGLVDNLPRVLPNDCDAVIETGSWQVPAIFQLLAGARQSGPREEMYQVFNMGIGMVAIVAPNDAAAVAKVNCARKRSAASSAAGPTRLSS